MSRAALYLRQSLDREGNELGVQRQEQECRRVCKLRALSVTEVVRDNNRSATSGERPGYEHLLKLIESKQIDVVVAYRLDRLLRRVVDLETLITLSEQTGVQIVTVQGDLDLTNSTGRLLGRILASVARSEMETKGERHRLANQQRAASGLPHGGRRAYGYNHDGMTVNEDEAVVLKEIAARFLCGWSYMKIAEWLNAEGHRTVMGNKFYGVAIRQMLLRVRYKGVREYNGALYPAEWPAIFDEHMFARIQYEVRRRSETLNDAPQPRTYLLTGLVYCGACGAAMNGSSVKSYKTGETRIAYRCNRERTAEDGQAGCGRVVRGAVPLEHFLRELIFYRLDTPELVDLLTSEDVTDGAAIHNKHQALVTRLEQLVDDYADGTLSKPEFIRARGRAQATLERVDKAISKLTRPATVSGLLSGSEGVRAAWQANPVEWRRQLVSLLVERIIVNSGGAKPRYVIAGKTYYFSPDLIDIQWRGA